MAYTITTNQYLSAADPIDTAPLTMAGWFNIFQINLGQFIFIISQSSSNIDNCFGMIVNSANNLRGIIRQAGANTTFDTTATISQNTWFHACVVFESSTSRTLYLNGGNSVTNTTSRTPVAANLTIITTGFGSETMRGRAADCAVWNTALTAAEVESLSKGFSASLIQPGNLVYYTPLIRNLSEIAGGATITNNGTATVYEHPRIYGI